MSTKKVQLSATQKKCNVAMLSIISNTSLVLLKFFVGIITGSISVISEAIHSSLDLFASFIAYFAVRKSSHPPDEKHHFGHGKIENISGAAEALLIFLAAAMIIWEAVEKIIHPHGMPKVELGIIVMAFSAGVNFLISNIIMQVAKETDSLALEADAWHLRTDVYTSLGVLVGLVIVKLTNLPVLDPIFAIGVALVIIKAAFELTTKTLEDLMDEKLPDSEEQKIKRIIKNCCPQVVGFHRFRTRKAGSSRFVDLHLVVPPGLSVEEAHSICDAIESSAEKEIPNLQMVIHVEPDKTKN